ncbi:MAG: signal peptidase I [Acidimicrobiia bacterium]
MLLLVAITIAVIIKTFLIQPFYIPSDSMVPTIIENDRVMVSKLSYQVGRPQRGDIVVFISPFNHDIEEESFGEAVLRHIVESVGIRTASADDLIKRVVAIAGDEVSVREGYLHLNGARVEEPYLLDPGIMPDFGPVMVPPESVFVMGDNRLVSYDSRRFGAIPMDRVLGEAVVRIWPPGRFGGVDSRP